MAKGMVEPKDSEQLTDRDVRAAIIASDFLSWQVGEATRLWPLRNEAGTAFNVMGWGQTSGAAQDTIRHGEGLADLGTEAWTHLKRGLALLDEYEVVRGKDVHSSALAEMSAGAEAAYLAKANPDKLRVGPIETLTAGHYVGEDGKRNTSAYTFHDRMLRTFWLRPKTKRTLAVAALPRPGRVTQRVARIDGAMDAPAIFNAIARLVR